MPYNYEQPGVTLTGANTVAPSDTYVQYNDGGVFGGDSNFTWNKTTKLFTITQNSLGTTSTEALILRNTTAAAVNAQQHSPRLVWEAQGWKTVATAASQSVKVSQKVTPIQSTSNPFARWELQKSINGASWSDMMTIVTGDASELTTATMSFAGKTVLTHNNSNLSHNISDILTLANTSGTASHLKFTIAGSPRLAISVLNTGQAKYIAGGSGGLHEFFTGSDTGSALSRIQIYSNGIYNGYSNFNGGVVTAGQADTAATAKLSSYGSFAVKGIVVTAGTYQVAATETHLYCDPSNANTCVGTPSVTACSTYSATNEATCEGHLPCLWVSTACSGFGGVDESTCETGHPGCTFETAECSGANNTDSTTCTDQGSIYGGGCSWDDITCGGYTDTVSCSGGNGCSPTLGGDCTSLSDGGGDGTACATQAECSYDSGTGVCSGSYFTSCSGSACNGTYFTGGCLGTWNVCSGTVTCGSYSTSGSGACTGEAGCSYVIGQTITLPQASVANRSNTARMYTFVHVGETGGSVTIEAYAGDALHRYTTLKLYKPGDVVSVHHHNATAACSIFTTSTPCNAQSPCAWQTAVVCSGLTDQSACEAEAACGCTWDSDLSTCSGAGCSEGCYGTYTIVNAWIVYNYERGRQYVEKTANYTLVDEDDIVNFTTAGCNATLPSAAIYSYKKFTVKNSAATGNVTFLTTSGQTIDGNASGVVVLLPGDSFDIESTGTNWIID